MEEVRFIALFRWGRRLLAIAFIVGMVVAQDTTNRFVVGLMNQHAATVTERMEQALEAFFQPPPRMNSNAPGSRGPSSRMR